MRGEISRDKNVEQKVIDGYKKIIKSGLKDILKIIEESK